ncbi:MAG: EamA family transporter [Nitrospirae bacterium]|nr:EamA family transporter [Nitrospirota bacterium]
MLYNWVILSLISALSLATSDALTKKALHEHNEYLVAWFRLVFSIPILLLLWLFIPKPELDTEFYQAFCFSLPLEIIAIIFYIKALRLSPLGMTLPFLSLTPMFLIIISYVILGEKVSIQGGFGIFLLAAGSYTLNLNLMRKGILEPFFAIKKEKGSVLMIFVAFIYSITSSLGKMAIEHSSPLFFGITYFLVLTIFFTPISLFCGRHELKIFMSEKKYKKLLFPGIFYSVMIVSHMIAMSLTNVAYMISVKRTSLLMGVLYGYFLFRERNLKERITGALLMFIGFIMIVTAS